MRKIYIILGLSFSLFCLIKLFAPEPAKNKELVQEFWIQKTHANSAFNVVVGGDSRVYRGISPNDINHATGAELSSINLGYSSGGLSNEYIDFCISKFDNKAESKVLVLGITPHSLTKEAFKNEAYLSYVEISAFNLFRYKYLSRILKHFSPYSITELYKTQTVNYQEQYLNNGWVASHYLEPDSSKALKSYTKTFLKYQVAESEVNAFLNKIKQISNQEISIIAFRPPSSSAMIKLEDSISGFDEEYIKKQLQNMGVRWMNFKESDFNSYDGSHLHYESAKELSKRIGIEASKLMDNQVAEIQQIKNH